MTQTIDQAMACFTPTLPVTVALSGGADSTALLLACQRKWPGQVRAVHVNHGLQVAADEFEASCRRICEALGVVLMVLPVNAKADRGQSPEDAARRARYKAFASLGQYNQALNATLSIAIAHHADDQIETVLLALSRGAGLAGLSGMAAQWERAGVRFHRPWLSVRGADIRQWLILQGQTFVEDPSNSDQRYLRNRIRSQLLPAALSCFAHLHDTLARSARHAAQAKTLLTELAQSDLATIGIPPRITDLQVLSDARLANLLRHWLLTVHQATPSTAQLDALMQQIKVCRTRAHQIALKVAHGCCRRQGNELHWYNPALLKPGQTPTCH